MFLLVKFNYNLKIVVIYLQQQTKTNIMKTVYNKIHQVTIEERDIPGMAGEAITVLVITFADDNPDLYVSNQTLPYFEQNDREELVQWLNDISESNAQAAHNFVM